MARPPGSRGRIGSRITRRGRVGERPSVHFTEPDGTVEELPGNAHVTVGHGDRFEIWTPGGGGFGQAPG